VRFFNDCSEKGRLAAFCIFLANAAAIGLAAPASAHGGAAFAGPDGWQVLCAATPQYCNTTFIRRDTLLDAKAIAQLEAFNSGVNAEIMPLDEPPGQDIWRLAPVFGDCEDYALTKKHRLLSAGWSGERLRFATVVTEAGEYHAVLLVDHADNWLVLDNRFETVRDWKAVEAGGYRLVAVEGFGADGAWRLTPYGSVIAMLARNGPAASR
jgi:predicted transglutaminase-like cysteine proteinase